MYSSACAADLRSVSSANSAGSGTRVGDRHHLAGIRAPRDLRRDVGRLERLHDVVARTGIGRELLPSAPRPRRSRAGANSRPRR